MLVLKKMKSVKEPKVEDVTIIDGRMPIVSRLSTCRISLTFLKTKFYRYIKHTHQ
jgi:hypothetical protein